MDTAHLGTILTRVPRSYRRTHPADRDATQIKGRESAKLFSSMIPPRHRRRASGAAPIHPFDQEHGTSTGSLIPGDQLATGHRHDRHTTAYHGVAPSLFRKLLSRWAALALNPVERTAFLDIGAGKGRAMLLAAERPFRRIVGVELHPGLAAVAHDNLKVWAETHVGPPMRLVEDDAMRLSVPAGPCLLFLFNPFDAVLMDRLLTRLTHVFSDRPGQLDLLYVNDEQRRLLQDVHREYSELWRGRIHLSHEDRDADKATIAHDADGLYVTTGYEDCGIWRLRL